MSGHSKWATIHRQKGVKDQARGKLFSKMGAAISIAVKSGGGPDPDSNFKLRIAIDKAKAANMPKENIDRAISKASDVGNLEEVTYEGFGPSNISVVIDATTDNRNRTGQEIKSLIEKSGGRFAGPGSVSFNYDPVGVILIKKSPNKDEQTLSLIDCGVSDIEELENEIECTVAPQELYGAKKKIEEDGNEVLSAELTMKPKSLQEVTEQDRDKVIKFLDNLSDHDDVSKVHTNALL